jgi:hypothetical protein
MSSKRSRKIRGICYKFGCDFSNTLLLLLLSTIHLPKPQNKTFQQHTYIKVDVKADHKPMIICIGPIIGLAVLP